MLRSILLAATLALLAAPVGAAEIRVLSPGFVYNSGMLDLAAQFTAKTGVHVIPVYDGMAAIIGHAKTAVPPADVVVLPLALMGDLDMEDGIAPGSYTPIGRVQVGLAVRTGAPHPDISTTAKLVAVLKAAGAVMYNDPKGGSMQALIIDGVLKRPDFAGVHGVSPAKGEGAQALSRGEGDMALQIIPEILNQKNVEVVGPLPSELGAYMDGAAAVSARATNPADAKAFIAFITRPEAAAVWKAKGLNPF
jgi:molybdate transport system substrate-binding protein